MTVSYRDMANAIRFLTIDAVEKANSGHPGLPMGMADVAAVLFRDFMHIDPAQPDWPNRDRFVLSAGHGAMLLYSIAHLLGYEDATIEQLQHFRQLGSKTPGHPEHNLGMMVETATGPLGQGFGNAVGMALAERILKADHHTYVIASDGDMMEGITHEAAALAGHLKLHKLIVMYDDNKISIDGSTDLSMTEDVEMRYKAYGWATRRIDGHDTAAIKDALVWAHQQAQPVMILCKTVIGFGAPKRAGTSKVHGEPLGTEEIAGTRAALGWPHAPFTVPADIKKAWEACAERGKAKRAKDTFKLPDTALTPAARKTLDDLKRKFLLEKPEQATRVSSGQALAAVVPHQPNLIGGSADLAGNTHTRPAGMKAIAPGDYAGQFIYYGVREHAMGAILNGLALSGGIIPYGGTFMVFSDYMRPAVRLAAFMNMHVVFVFSHDSIGVGHDGPTHQPVEQMAALRAIPNLRVIRPADALETAEAWEVALTSPGPTALCLTRQNVPFLKHPTDHGNDVAHGVHKGGYMLREEAGALINLIATGSEVGLAVQVAEKLFKAGHPANVISLPCVEMFLRQSPDYIDRVLPPHAMPVVIEAGVKLGWDRLLGDSGMFFGVDTFGTSAPFADAFRHYGLTANAIADAILKKM
ncbi:MAG: transketolase [Bdellovibrionales bacterium]